MTYAEDTARIEAYTAALDRAWKNNPDWTKQQRFTGFVSSPRLSRILWIRWVEANAEHIEWCGDLVRTAVTLQLGIK